jgi:hypothetical protein
VFPDISNILKETNWPKVVVDGDVVMVFRGGSGEPALGSPQLPTFLNYHNHQCDVL